MRTAEFDFQLPSELIAQFPAMHRDQSRLLVLHRANGRLEHRQFADLTNDLRSGDVLVLNDSKVIPARLHGAKSESGGAIEVLLLEEIARNEWWVMLRPAKRVRARTVIRFHDCFGSATEIEATVLEKNLEGHCRPKFSGTSDIADELDRIGEMPLPPYIIRQPHSANKTDVERYQTVYARRASSVAAPTAGLHFREALLGKIRARGVLVHFVTLHVGLGTFAPVKAGDVREHVMHEERFQLSESTASTINDAKADRRRVFAVGTTTLRVLESVARANGGKLTSAEGRTCLFIHPPYSFQAVDGLVTNFHLPHSTLLMLVSAFAAPGQVQGRELVLRAYAEAIRQRYRFFSYGDAMLIL